MNLKLSTRVFAGFLVIALLFTVVVAVNYQLSRQVLRNTLRVERSQQISAAGTTLLRHVLDMEGAFRGYLLLGNETLLVPYYKSERALLSGFPSLKRRLKPDGPQHARLVRAEHLYQQWAQYSHLLIAEKRQARRMILAQHGLNGLEHRALMENMAGKSYTDELRVMFLGFDQAELRDRTELRDRLAASILQTRLISLVLTLLAIGLGVVWALYTTRQLASRLTSMVGLATRLAGGDYQTRIEDQAQDEMSELSASLNTMARKINRTVTELEGRNQELDQFAYVVSHDLKAPLRGIESATRWIEEDMDESLPAHIREFLTLMRTRVRRMENLISGILELARAGRTAHHEERVVVRELLQETIEMQNLPEGFKVELPVFLPTLFTSRVELQQVLANLLSNAVKYHHDPAHGRVRIGCTEHRTHYTFSVADNGPGIAPEYHERIFVLFQTLTERDTLESTGVGLALVKKLVDRQGGTVTVESAEGQGATFIFTWPKVREKRTEAAMSTPTVAAR